ncbi:putative membrane protein [Encephalitozoon romaleae SJ-2008]|uniref:Membrane protein n=1 Tax=Encephalitozoon romaleae (strain SJ-2008) TaxID=1178016 RepID=I6ZIN4_ENCRO|nr:putative membrane protein [Encephalitozoon romaleae SJ-2008]AFN83083.1 putative membrane protein [Encephalitozoon romaleae SJ-2008]
MIRKISEVNYLERRFLASLFLTLFVSYTMRNRARAHNLLSAMLILYVAFDHKHTAYILASIALNIFLLKYVPMTEYSFTLVNIMVLYVYKIFGGLFEERISGSFDISGVLMLMTIKMCYLGKEYNKRTNTIKDALSYILFIPGLMLGPVPTFKDFMENKYEKPKKPPYETFLKSFGFLILFQALRVSVPRSHLLEENISLPMRLVYIYLFTVGNRIKFYFAWHFSHGCFTFQNFPNLLNADFIKVELATSVKDLSTYWNICTGVWLKNCFFVPMKKRSIFWASLATSAVSALWHGINPCYLVMFLSLSISIPVVKENNRLIQHFFPSLFWILSRVQMLLLTTYFTASFFLLDISDLIYVWRSVYFAGHIVLAFSLIVQTAIKFFSPPVEKKRTD